MTSVHIGILLAGLLLLLGIASSKFSSRLGMPVLVVFLGVGMLAGSQGVGGIPFEDYRLAHDMGSVALALILFDGGLQTSLSSIRAGWKPALALSTVGVLITSALTAVIATLVFDISPMHGALIGCIVGSTDAAAVFSVLRTGGLRLPERLAATLEVESGSNDPMAIFLTLGLVQLMTGEADGPGALILLLVLQFGVGALIGLGVGRAAVLVVNRISLDHRAMYPLLVISFGLLAFGLAAALGGSGFLATYVAGIVVGNSALVFRRGIAMFHDATAWLSQIALFVMLGLLSFPDRLIAVGVEGLVVALALMFVARPVAVALVALPFRFPARETALLAWGGLKGAVPITLATFPLLAGIEGSSRIFDAVFFVVLVSALAQGWSLPLVATRLGLAQPADPTPPVTVEVHALQHLEWDIVDFLVAESAPLAGKPLREFALPHDLSAALVLRDGAVLVPRGSTVLRPDDHVFVAMRQSLTPLVSRLFARERGSLRLEPGFSMKFDRRATLGQLHELLGLAPPARADLTVGGLLSATGDDTGDARVGPFRVVAHDNPELVTLTLVDPVTDGSSVAG